MSKETNPMIQDHPDETVHRVTCALEYLSCTELQSGYSMTGNIAMGEWLVLETMIEALKNARQEILNKPQ